MDYTEYDPQKSRDSVQSLVARMHEKSKALFQTDFKRSTGSASSPLNAHQNERNYGDHQNRGNRRNFQNRTDSEHDDPDRKAHAVALTNFDDQLQTTWSKTQLRLKKIERMNAHFTRNNNESHQMMDKYRRTVDTVGGGGTSTRYSGDRGDREMERNEGSKQRKESERNDRGLRSQRDHRDRKDQRDRGHRRDQQTVFEASKGIKGPTVSDSVASSHWALDTEPSRSVFVQKERSRPLRLKRVNEESSLQSTTSSVDLVKSPATTETTETTFDHYDVTRNAEHEITTKTISSNAVRPNTMNTVNTVNTVSALSTINTATPMTNEQAIGTSDFGVQTLSRSMTMTKYDHLRGRSNVDVNAENVLNLSFNRGVQVRIPVLCQHCNRTMDVQDIEVIRKETEDEIDSKMECPPESERRVTRGDSDGVIGKIYSSTTSISTSSSFVRGRNDEVELATTMSEADRKRLIMDLKAMEMDHDGSGAVTTLGQNSGGNGRRVQSESFSDGMGRCEENRNRFANRILNETEPTKGSKESKPSLRERLKELKKEMGLEPDDKESGHYTYLQHQTRVYHHRGR